MTLHIGDVREVLPALPAESVQMCVTSPPYWGLRDYGSAGQLGLEPTPEEYVANMVGVFREVRRVLKDDGTLWLNIGDSYAAARAYQVPDGKHCDVGNGMSASVPPGLKPKDLVGIPWRVAFALQADGWYLRSDIIWHKPAPMPESVTDRPTKAHEYLFLLTKNARYHYDAEAIAEPSTGRERWFGDCGYSAASGRNDGGSTDAKEGRETRNRRSVWTVPTQPYSGAHFAVFPPALIEPCILAGSRPGDVVLDPFFGSGTTGEVCERLGRRWEGVELNAEYATLAHHRTAQMGMAI